MQFRIRKQWRNGADAFWSTRLEYYTLEILICGKWFYSEHEYSRKATAKKAALNIGCCEEIE